MNLNEEGGEMITQEITWREIKQGEPYDKPDADDEVMVYDTVLDDVVFASLDLDSDSEEVWVDTQTDEQLVAPAWWAAKPYPEG